MKNYNNPLHAAQQVTYHITNFHNGYHTWLKRERSALVLNLLALTVLTVGTQGVLSQITPKVRPYIGVSLYSLYTMMAYGLSDTIRFRKEADNGLDTISRIGVEATENLVQRMAQRGYVPYRNDVQYPDDDALPTELGREPTPITLPHGVEYINPPVLEKTLLSGGLADLKLPGMVVGGTGSGKTTLLMNVVGILLEQGKKVIVFDCKPVRGKTFEKFGDSITYVPLGHYDETPTFVTKLKAVVDMVMSDERTEDSEPIHVIIDEINNGITKAELYVKESGDKSRPNEKISMYSELLLSQGRQKNVPTLGTTHDAGTGALGYSSSMRNNMRFAILGSPTSYENVEAILNATIKLITDEETRTELREQYKSLKPQLATKFYALTNVLGRWKFVS